MEHKKCHDFKKNAYVQYYEIRPCINNRPQRCVSTSGEEEDPERSFFTVEALL